MGRSQSERIVWLAEELGIEYEFVMHHRDPVFSPQSIRDLHPAGTAPVMVDDPPNGERVVLAESGAIVEYMIQIYGGGRLARTPDSPEYAHYLEWLHFANGTAQPTLLRLLMARRLSANQTGGGYAQSVESRWNRVLSMLEARLAQTQAYLAGPDLTAADIMTVFTLTTMRGFCPVEFDPDQHRNILSYLRRVGDRPAYRRAMAICEGDDFEPLLGPKVEAFTFVPK
jgi:glutathione S-transferase